MRKIHGVVAVPITACLLLAMVGCTGTVAAAPGAADHGTVAPTNTSSNSAEATTPTATGPASPIAEPTHSGATTAPPAQAPFPGIWDITSWEQYRAMQAALLQGHQPWLQDPSMVVDAWAHRWQPAPAVHQVSENVFQVIEPGTNITYTIRGTRPDPDSAAPIWVITSISHN